MLIIEDFLVVVGFVVLRVVNSNEEVLGKVIDVGFIVDLKVDNELETRDETYIEELFEVILVEDILVVVFAGILNGFSEVNSPAVVIASILVLVSAVDVDMAR